MPNGQVIELTILKAQPLICDFLCRLTWKLSE